MGYDIPEEKLEAIRDQVRKGRKIEAIKLFREAAGVDLKEAKEAVEAMIEKEPKPVEGIGPKGCAGVVFLLLVSASVVLAALV